MTKFTSMCVPLILQTAIKYALSFLKHFSNNNIVCHCFAQ